MRTLMLGWEFPPFISGGLGTACYGLTKALSRLGHETLFVLPRAVDRTQSSHVKLLSPAAMTPEKVMEVISHMKRDETGAEVGTEDEEVDSFSDDPHFSEDWLTTEEASHVTFKTVPAKFSSPYGQHAPLTEEQIRVLKRVKKGIATKKELASLSEDWQKLLLETTPAKSSAPTDDEDTTTDPNAPTPGFLGLNRQKADDYSGDLLGDVRRYAELCVALTRGEEFDVIHAHDWMTYPAGMAVARMTGKPLVVHVHSTEFDRSGENVNQQVYEIERRGMHSAMLVATVSYWTRNIVMHRYDIDPDRIRVVWNGNDTVWQDIEKPKIHSTDKIVLFLGRITMQKGPEYFLAAAKRVLDKVENVKFIIAGSGDMVTRTIELAAQMGIGHKVLFTGFLRGPDVARVYKMADCYVMPSVSEPFGLAPLEAMSHDVPVIISKQSGVSECLTHVLKVDFWDVDDMANKIVAVLRYPPLSQTLRHHGGMELHSLTWDGAAQKCIDIYREAVDGVTLTAAV